jgi:glycine/D-amino acid oxidase-like deaminating enzyme
MSQTFDCVVVGGGLVGSAVAYGLSKQCTSVALLDEGDSALRASRGNFGLVWAQGKGVGFPAYADWTRYSVEAWPTLEAELHELTGAELAYSKPGGLHVCIDEAEYAEREQALQTLQAQTEGRFSFEMLDNQTARELAPALADDIPGASYCALDGHLNPLYLLRALHEGFLRQQGQYLPDRRVTMITPQTGSFRINTAQGSILCERLVLTAGLANRALGRMVGLEVPVAPNKGQILVTEKLAPLLNLPTVQVRQTFEGGVMIGDSHEETGLETETSSAIMATISRRAVRMFPVLRTVRLVRAWAALRVMTPDGKPIYQQSEQHPGAFVATCHSGVTLAANHALRLPDWLLGNAPLPAIEPFVADRFHSKPVSL